MESNLLLKIKDPALRDEYYEKRSKEILSMSSIVAALAILINIVTGIFSIVLKWDEYVAELWTGRITAIFFNLILIILQYKYPLRLSPIHGPILVLS